MDRITCIVYGKPVPKGRPRFTRRGKFVQTYTPKKTLDYEKQISAAYIAAHGTMFPSDVPLKVHVAIFLPIPKGTKVSVKEEMRSGVLRPIRARGDVDNYVKSVLDGLNGFAFADDRQVVCIAAEKYYSDTPRIEVTVSDDSR